MSAAKTVTMRLVLDGSAMAANLRKAADLFDELFPGEAATPDDVLGRAADTLFDEQPTSVGPVPLELEVRNIGCICKTCTDERTLAVEAVRERLSQYPADTPVAVVHADLFGGDAS